MNSADKKRFGRSDYAKRKRLVIALARDSREASVPESFQGFNCRRLLLDSFDESDYEVVKLELLDAGPEAPEVIARPRPGPTTVVPLRGDTSNACTGRRGAREQPAAVV